MSSQQSTANSPRKSQRHRWLWLAGILPLIALGVWGVWEWSIHRFAESCRVAQEEHRWNDLEGISRRWSWYDPSSAEPWIYLADAVQHQERYVEAAEYLARVPQHSPEYLPAQLGRAKILFGPANRPFDGEDACREILSHEPLVGGAHELLIQFYAVTLQRTKLREQVKSAIQVEREPRDAFVYYFLIDTLRLGEGVSLNGLWLNSYPDDEILSVAQMLHGDDAAHSYVASPESVADDMLSSVGTPVQRTTESNAVADAGTSTLTIKEHAARQLLDRFPHNANLLAYLADQELAKGNVDQVIKLLAQTQPDTEADPRFWRFKGWVHFTRKEYPEAESAYRKALSIHPLDWLTMHRLAEILRIRGLTDEVTRLEKLVDRAHELRPRIRELRNVRDSPVPLLKEIGRFARDAGDSLIADALTKRLGSLE
ncbi:MULTISPECIES: tetratricopeptide repeat protein [unclassified Schlesneria]|uniref:tetratricopeptide repeat protein n=1 Tax=unclassified Schlesneria TaxID=2762017 RepID=UPI002F16EFD4